MILIRLQLTRIKKISTEVQPSSTLQTTGGESDSLKHFISNDHSAVCTCQEEDICGPEGGRTINDFSHDSETCGLGSGLFLSLCLDSCDWKESHNGGDKFH